LVMISHVGFIFYISTFTKVLSQVNKFGQN